jgi:CHASE3 domain sensor protein
MHGERGVRIAAQLSPLLQTKLAEMRQRALDVVRNGRGKQMMGTIRKVAEAERAWGVNRAISRQYSRRP